MFRSILVATDGSSHAESAVRLASDMAARYAARLSILHAISSWEIPSELNEMVAVEHLIEPPAPDLPPIASGSFERTDPEQRYQAARALSEKILERARATAESAGARSIEVVSLEGGAADVILEQARQRKADLVVVGTRGLGRLGGMILGSVSHKVGALAPCPCLIAR